MTTSIAPATVGTRSMVSPRIQAVLDPFLKALAAADGRGPSATVAWGLPEPDDGEWLDLDEFRTEAGAAPGWTHYDPDPNFAKLLGNWVFQNTAVAALLLAGYLYAAQRRVPALQGNALVHNSEWLKHLRLLQPRLWVLPGDPLAGADGITTVADQQALTDALFAETQRTYEPIVQGFRARRHVSIPNAWAAVVDSLLQGFLLAGRAEIGLDAAWELWQTTTSDWEPATRRWPRRIPFAQDGFTDEVVVRASCCLFWTTSDSSGAKQANCSNCPVKIGEDDGRIERMVSWLKYLEAERQAAADRPPTTG